MASKLGVTALYVTPTQESGGPLTPRTARIAATALLAFAAERRAAVDMDRKAATPAADAPCSNRSTSPDRFDHKNARPPFCEV